MHAGMMPGIERGTFPEGVGCRGATGIPGRSVRLKPNRALVPKHESAISDERTTHRFDLRDEMSFSFPILGNEELVASLEELHVPLDEKALEKPAYESVKPAYDALVQSLVGVSWCVSLAWQRKTIRNSVSDVMVSDLLF